MDFIPFIIGGSFGLRTYFVKQKTEDLPKALRFCRNLRLLDISAKVLFGLWAIYAILKYVDNKFF